MTEKENRRKFIIRCVSFSKGVVGSTLFLHGCGETNQRESPKRSEQKVLPPATDPCTNFSGVPQEELEIRKSMGYVEESQLGESSCSNCSLYIPFNEKSECGKCLLFKGPVFAAAHCVQWVSKAQ